MGKWALDKATFLSTGQFNKGITFLLVSLWGWLWFFPLRNSAFAMDDPGLLNKLLKLETAPLEWAITETGANRWRPLANALQAVVFGIAGNDYTGWWMANVAIVTVLSGMIAVYLLTKTGSIVLSLSAAIVFQTSRFLQYNVTQAFGLMESLALIFVFLIVALVHQFFLTGKPKYLWWIAPVFLCVTLTHERFQALLPVLLLFMLVQKSVAARAKVLLAVLYMFPVVLISIVKMFVFGIPLAVGTGSSTEIGFSPISTLKHTSELVLNLLGINFGEGYLHGLVFDGQSQFQQTMSLAIAVMSALIGVYSFAKVRTARGVNSRFPPNEVRVYALLCVMLSIPILITIRLEPRWLSSIWLVACVVLPLIWVRTGLVQKKAWLALVVVFSTLNVGQNVVYWTNFDNVYFRAHQLSAQIFLSEILPIWKQASLSGSSITLVSQANSQATADFLDQLVTSNSSIGSQSINGVDAPVGTIVGKEGELVIYFDQTTGAISIGDK